MKNESKHELAAADKTLSNLQAATVEKASDPEIYRLGQLLRESADTEMPESDPGLREQLVTAMDRLPELNELPKDASQKIVAHKYRKRRRLAFLATATLLMLAIGGTLFVSTANDYFQSAKRRHSPQIYTEVQPAENQKPLAAERLSGKEKILAAEKISKAPQGASSGLQIGETIPIDNSQSHVHTDDPKPVYDYKSQLSSPKSEHEPLPPPTSRPVGQATAALNQPDEGEGKRPFVNNAPSKPSPPSNKKTDVLNTRFNAAGGRGGKNRPAEFLSGGEVRPIRIAKSENRDGQEGSEQVLNFFDGQRWQRKRLRRQKFTDIRLSILPAPGLFEETTTEQYDMIVENQFIQTIGEQALSTFSIDVDTASYSNMRRFINAGQMPPPNSVRIEEFVNYFHYDYPQPEDGKPFRVQMEVAECPWQPVNRLVRVGIKGQDVHRDERPASNLVFLLDVSGSMNNADKLPLLQRGLQMMIDRLTENDFVSIVTYAGNAGVRLEPTSGDQKRKVRDVIDNLAAGGSTNGSAGIEKAYELAAKHFIKDGTNRVILATDGDLNVGITDDQSLVNLIKDKASEGVFLTVLGFGTGNLKDSKLEKLADNGNGLYAYIDSIREARKVLVEQMSGSLVTIAKDVKLQVVFNPAEVQAYRLLGYENRKMANADFANDKKDAGDIGAGHTVTALYEIVPAGLVEPQTPAANLIYQQPALESESEKPSEKIVLTAAAKSGDLLTLAIRYKLPLANESTRSEYKLADSKQRFYEASEDFRFAAAVASFGMLLRNSQFSGDMDLTKVEKIASEAIGKDQSGYRAEFVDLVRQLASDREK